MPRKKTQRSRKVAAVAASTNTVATGASDGAGAVPSSSSPSQAALPSELALPERATSATATARIDSKDNDNGNGNANANANDNDNNNDSAHEQEQGQLPEAAIHLNATHVHGSHPEVHNSRSRKELPSRATKDRSTSNKHWTKDKGGITDKSKGPADEHNDKDIDNDSDEKGDLDDHGEAVDLDLKPKSKPTKSQLQLHSQSPPRRGSLGEYSTGSASSSASKGRMQEFPRSLFAFVTLAATKYPDVVQWTSDGRGFHVDKKHAALGPLLRRYFQHDNYTSLRIQLNWYGFGFDKEHHFFTRQNYFHKDHPEDIDKILRRPTDHLKRNRQRTQQRRQQLRKAAAVTKVAPDSKATNKQPKGKASARKKRAKAKSTRTSLSSASSISLASAAADAAHADNDDDDQHMDLEVDEDNTDFNDSEVDYDLSTYATLDTTDDQSLEQRSDCRGPHHNNSNNDNIPRELDAFQEDHNSNSNGDDDVSLSASRHSITTTSQSHRQTAKEDWISTAEPEAKPQFHAFQKVFARDKDGVMYEAVVRRRLYGVGTPQQEQVGVTDPYDDNQEVHPTWHYFVHYNRWNVRWDRWLAEHDIFEINDTMKQYVQRLFQEHKILTQEMTKKMQGKKVRQSIDGAEFLREWKRRLAKLAQEMTLQLGEAATSALDPTSGGENKSKSASAHEEEGKKDGKASGAQKETFWTKAALALEQRLRQNNLTTKRPQKQASMIAVPFALKKVLVEQWEVISQCNMLPCLPAPITVRQALDLYLQSRHVHLASSHDDVRETDDPGLLSTSLKAASLPTETDHSKTPNALRHQSTHADMPLSAKSNQHDQEWIDMADGIAMLFDEALPTQLLYREEWVQYSVLLETYGRREHSIFRATRPCEIYGCEHLLRLFVRLPALLLSSSDQQDDDDDGFRHMLGQINDLVRFLHRQQATLFAQTYRKRTEVERNEEDQVLTTKMTERKRQVEHEQEQQQQKERGDKRKGTIVNMTKTVPSKKTKRH